MLDMLLVSKSPRRKEILENAGFCFVVDTMEVSEIVNENINPSTIVCSISKAKGQAYLESSKGLKLKDKLVVSADTLVFLGDKVLGKPTTPQAAVEILHNLSNQTHCVITGLYIYNTQTKEEVSEAVTTEVRFRKLSESEILAYVKTGDPMDKAGAYGIQGEAKKFVEDYKGSYFNVVGFPIERFEEIIDEKGWKLDRRKS